MELMHCIYCSRAAGGEFPKDDLEILLEHSRLNNKNAEITGILLYDAGTFFQVIEGDKPIIGALFKKIAQDPRHENITKLIYEPIEQRSFGEWSMGYPKVSRKELESIPGLNDFFLQGHSFADLEEGRAKTLLEAFQQGKWRT